MANFADINVAQGSVATYATCGGILIIHLTTNLARNLPVKKIKLVKISQNCGHEAVPTFLAHPVCAHISNAQFIPPTRIGATAPWDPQDASPPTFQNLYFVTSSCCDWLSFLL